MNFDLSEEQKLLAESVKRLLEREYTFEQRKKIVASEAGYSDQVWKAFADLGLLALPISTDYGGFGGTAVDLMPVMELFGEALVVEPYLSTIMCARMLDRAGGGEAEDEGSAKAGAGGGGGGDGQSRHSRGDGNPDSAEGRHSRGDGNPAGEGTNDAVAGILGDVCEGKLKLAFAHLEDNARYDLSHVDTAATPDGEGFVLSGTKRVVLHASSANLWLVSARTHGHTTDEEGISLFLVNPKSEGIKLTAYQTIDELRGADITFTKVRVPAEAVVGELGKALPIIEDGVDYGTALLCAEAVGAMKYACDATLEYLKTRKQFGVAIGSFQALQHRMVDMVIEKEQCLSMASLAVGAFGSSAETRRSAVDAAALRVREGCEKVSKESVQLHGGMGMTEELKVSHTFRHLTGLKLTS